MGESIKHFIEIESLLTAIYYPKEVAVTPCKGHSRDWSKVAKGNHIEENPEGRALRPTNIQSSDSHDIPWLL